MINKNFIVSENDKFIRVDIREMSVNELYDLLVCDNFIIFFVVFEKDRYFIRYKLDKIKKYDDLLDLLHRSIFRKNEFSIDSGDVSIIEASYIDCYKYPK